VALRREGNHTLWIENSVVPDSWQFSCNHVITGAPDNDWSLRLEPGTCLDFAPIGEDLFCLRTYGFEDTFHGKLGDAATCWLGRPASEWFNARGLNLEECGLDAQTDIQFSPIFPVLERSKMDSEFIQWLL